MEHDHLGYDGLPAEYAVVVWRLVCLACGKIFVRRGLVCMGLCPECGSLECRECVVVEE
jgi:rRNA maturation endonuclease Nob1